MLKDLQTIIQLIKPEKGHSHAERLENFYSQQADNYDEFRKKLLPGRESLMKRVSQFSGGIWIDMGCGTGSNLDLIAQEALHNFDEIHMVDLSPSLLKKAQSKAKNYDCDNIYFHKKDVCEFSLEKAADVISFSYSLTMIPQWFKAIDRAYSLLKPGGKIAIVDFYVAPKHPLKGMQPHSKWTRNFWPLWFAWDNVRLNPDHLPYLMDKFEKVQLFEGYNKVPYAPFGKVPYYHYIGTKPLNH